MGRRVSVGIFPTGGVGGININDGVLRASETNGSITLQPDGTGNIVGTSNIVLNAQSDLRFADSDSSHYVAFQAPGTVASSVTWTLPAADGTGGQVLTTNGSGTLTWAFPVPWTSTTQTSNFSAVSLGQYFVDTAGGAVTATLPASPGVGDEIRFFDLRKTFDTNALTVSRNGRPIMGDTANLTVNTEGAAFALVYSGNTYGWRIFTV